MAKPRSPRLCQDTKRARRANLAWVSDKEASRRAGKPSRSLVRRPAAARRCLGGSRQSRQVQWRSRTRRQPASSPHRCLHRLLSLCTAFSNTRCTVMRHGSSAVDCQQIKTLQHSTARHFTVGQQVEALATATASVSCHSGSHIQPGHCRAAADKAKSKPSPGSSAPRPGSRPAGQDGMSLRLFGALQGEHVGEPRSTHSPRTAMRISAGVMLCHSSMSSSPQAVTW
ncbi:hypothetical protein SSTU70S_06957 [Stutzerimonas stutzeri]